MKCFPSHRPSTNTADWETLGWLDLFLRVFMGSGLPEDLYHGRASVERLFHRMWILKLFPSQPPFFPWLRSWCLSDHPEDSAFYWTKHISCYTVSLIATLKAIICDTSFTWRFLMRAWWCFHSRVLVNVRCVPHGLQFLMLSLLTLSFLSLCLQNYLQLEAHGSGGKVRANKVRTLFIYFIFLERKLPFECVKSCYTHAVLDLLLRGHNIKSDLFYLEPLDVKTWSVRVIFRFALSCSQFTWCVGFWSPKTSACYSLVSQHYVQLSIWEM